MDCKLLTAAAIAAAFAFSPAPAAPVTHRVVESGVPHFKQPQAFGETQVIHGFGHCGDFDRDRRDGHRDMRRDGSFGCGFDGGFAYADGGWALANNRSWEPDSYNDWWHDRPDRAFPRWVREQHRRGTCDPDRMWWSGAGWRC